MIIVLINAFNKQSLMIKALKTGLDFQLIVIGIVFSIILFFLTPNAHWVIIKDDQFYHADKLEPVEINGILYFLGGMNIDTIDGGGWQGDYPLYQYAPSPNWLYSLAGTAIIVSLLRIYKEYKN